MNTVVVNGEVFDNLLLMENFYEVLNMIKKASSVTKQAKRRAATFCLEALKTGLVKINKTDYSLLKYIVS